MTTDKLSEGEERALLRLARSQIEETVGAPKESPAPGPAELPEMSAGAFVSLHVEKRLRGCIGTFETTRPVHEQVREMAVAAATRDPRFPPLTAAELAGADIEISVLTPPRKVDSPEDVRVGEHGIVIRRGYQRGVLLPQVATDNGWDRETFLAHTCVKAGLPAEAWRDPGTTIEVFTAQVFGESEE